VIIGELVKIHLNDKINYCAWYNFKSSYEEVTVKKVARTCAQETHWSEQILQQFIPRSLASAIAWCHNIYYTATGFFGERFINTSSRNKHINICTKMTKT